MSSTETIRPTFAQTFWRIWIKGARTVLKIAGA